MAVPWQTDTSSCLSGYVPIMGQYVPTFWPVRVPNDVLSEEDYLQLMNPKSTLQEKNDAFAKRVKWLRGVVYEYGYPPKNVKPYTKGINEFITEWPQVGILIQKEAPAMPNFPEKMWVENGRTITAKNLSLSIDKSIPEEQDITDDGYLWMVDRANKRRKVELVTDVLIIGDGVAAHAAAIILQLHGKRQPLFVVSQITKV